jgi:myxalamid-type polyketide synthase MxaC
LHAREDIRFRADASYLISGGLGRLGLLVALWMAERGAGHLVLVGRHGLPPRSEWDDEAPFGATYERIEAVRRIESAGAQVLAVAADAADPIAMTSLFARFGTSLPELRGIVHAAADLQERAIEAMTAADMAAVFRPKIAGAALLDRLSRHKPLDWFVLFSSGASVWGSRRLAHHAAACQFLDALAHERRAAGLPATSINWGWWAGGNTTEEEDRFFEGTGLRRMDPLHALDVFGRLLAANATQKIVSAFDWSTFKPIYESSRRRPLLDAIQVSPRAAAAASQAPADLLRRIDEARAKDRWPLLVDHVHDHVVNVLGFDRGTRVDIREGFFRMGMDSIMTIQLRNRLATALGVALPPTLAFECPTIEAVARFVAHEALGWPREDSPASGDAHSALAEPAEDDLSEDSLTLLLAQKLDQLR